tara:strand:+ start:560 stop:922 length:363 start_codon:yes stop_codon:yes gene_type:complete
MASTRNRNTLNDYKLEQRNNVLINQYNTYENSQQGAPVKPKLPELGFNPSFMGREQLSHNPIEIESFLFGINSTNLVNPSGPPVPKFKSLNNESYFDRIPILMPEPLAIRHNQRPLPIPQ